MKSAVFFSVVAVAAADTCSLFEIADGSCGQSDLDCAYVKYAKAAEAALADGTCADQGYTVKTGTQTKSYPIIGDIVITTYDKAALSKGTPSKIFLEGFIEGFIGKAEHIKACLSQSVLTEQAVVKFIKDAKARKWDSIISDIQSMIGEVGKELPTCKGAGQDLAPIFQAFKDVHSISDAAHKMKENFLANDRAILDIVEDMLEVCTFGAPDAHKCGMDLGKQSRAIVIGSVSKPALSSTDMDWAQYKQQFGKTYNGESEDAEREAIFNQNKQMWGQHESGAILGATVFSDLTAEEFASMPIRGFASGEASGLPKVGVHEFQGEELAAAVDWSTRGAVTPVKNQGQCGSCWAFSSTGGLEGSYQISSGKLVSLSEQQFVDCSKQNSGCNGGLMDYAFAFAEGTAVATESSYPYTARDGTCKTSFTTGIPRGGVTGYKDVSRSTSALQSALNVMPVSVAIQADQSVFQQYTGGVITSGCGTSLDHGVLAVGYDGTTIKVKNSWGTSWGVNGYVSIDASQCGITSSASYPTTSAAVEV